jgi:hypothetical protein
VRGAVLRAVRPGAGSPAAGPKAALRAVAAGRATACRRANPLAFEGTGYFARCLEHESDRLDGQVHLDLLSRRGREDALRQVAERRERVVARRAAKESELSR